MNSTLSPSARQDIAASLLGRIEWQDSNTGFCQCPGKARHTHPTGKHDCRVTLDNVPTVFCFHQTCQPDIERVNHELRAGIFKAAIGGATQPRRRSLTPDEISAGKQREYFQNLKLRAESSLAQILASHAFSPADFFELSPVRLMDNPANDWRLFLHLFPPTDIVWIGDTKDSCGANADARRMEYCRRHFRPVADWLKESDAPGQFTCPSVFKTGTHSRSNDAVLQRRFLVIESDVLSKDEMGAVISWCRQFMRLRAIVDTAGKSLHGWFDAPGSAVERELKVILPALGFDAALFKLGQPCQLAGARRGEKWQALLFLDLERMCHE